MRDSQEWHCKDAKTGPARWKWSQLPDLGYFASLALHSENATMKKSGLRLRRRSKALFKLVDANLKNYPQQHKQLNLGELRDLTARWLAELEAGGFKANPLTAANRLEIALPA
jgi:hypothetical protein